MVTIERIGWNGAPVGGPDGWGESLMNPVNLRRAKVADLERLARALGCRLPRRKPAGWPTRLVSLIATDLRRQRALAEMAASNLLPGSPTAND